MCQVHELKTWPKPFQAIKNGELPAQLRKNDREYKQGDILRLHEWEPDTQRYTGEVVRVVINRLFADLPELPQGFVLLVTRPLVER